MRRRRRPASTPVKPRQDSKERATVAMFVDIMGASEVSNHKSPGEYAEFVVSFQRLFLDVCRIYREIYYGPDFREFWFDARGDEGLLLIYPDSSDGDMSPHVDAAVNVALELKRRWLCSKFNKERIQNFGLLPTDLAIGIHAGQTYLVEKERNGEKVLAPEGYAINLAKRVESHSREGRFTHILLSEAAHGHLEQLPDEKVYLFDVPQTISPKGISRNIRVFEVTHHFLPTDWRDEPAGAGQSKALVDASEDELEILNQALMINPTNTWLAEECIRSHMLCAIKKLTQKDRDDDVALSKAFEDARQVASRLSHGEQRSAGVLFIEAFVEGECGNYAEEQEKYLAAISDVDQLAEAYWYLAQSLSYEVTDAVEPGISFNELEPEFKEKVNGAISYYRDAKTRRPLAAWVLFDYGCELVHWERSPKELNDGIENIELAFNRLKGVGREEEMKMAIRGEPYLQRQQDNPRIKKLLQ